MGRNREVLNNPSISTAEIEGADSPVTKKKKQVKAHTQVTIVLSEEAYNRFQQEAKADDRPLSKYLARILNRWHITPDVAYASDVIYEQQEVMQD